MPRLKGQFPVFFVLLMTAPACGGPTITCPPGFLRNARSVCEQQQCESHLECSDGDPCTINLCNMEAHVCAPPQPKDCNGNAQCESRCGDLCDDDRDCADNRDCTNDRCVAGRCENIEALCGPGSFCDPSEDRCVTTDPILVGDCSQDGEVSAHDALCIESCMLGDEDEKADCGLPSDCNCDGRLTEDDAHCVARRAVGGAIVTRCEARPGDCNNSGTVDATDALCIQHCLAGNAPGGADCLRAGDCNCDGTLDLEDVICAQTRAVDLMPSREFCEIDGNMIEEGE